MALKMLNLPAYQRSLANAGSNVHTYTVKLILEAHALIKAHPPLSLNAKIGDFSKQISRKVEPLIIPH